MGRFIAAVLSFVAFVLLAIAHLLLSAKVTNQQRQIDEFSAATLDWVLTQERVEKNASFPVVEKKYDVFFVDFGKELAVITSEEKDGKTCYHIHHNVSQALLRHWSKNRHFQE